MGACTKYMRFEWYVFNDSLDSWLDTPHPMFIWYVVQSKRLLNGLFLDKVM